jgi:hypothetical protein
LAIDDDCRNDSADAKVRAENPSDLTRSSIAARVKEWSSTIDISGGMSVNSSPSPGNKQTGSHVSSEAQTLVPQND